MKNNYDLFEPYPISPVKITRFVSYGSTNYKVEDLDGQTYLFKHHMDRNSIKRIKAENKIMTYLSKQLPIEVSSPSYDGAYYLSRSQFLKDALLYQWYFFKRC